MMNKKGQGMPLNVLIIAIIVIVVLILLLTFFFGGFVSLSDKIKQIFSGATGGQEEGFVVQSCERACITIQSRTDPGNDAARQAMYKGTYFCQGKNVDLNGDGVLNKEEETPKERGLTCEGLGVTCMYTTKDGKLEPVTCKG